MNPFEALVASMADAVEIDPGGRTTWFGEPIPDLPPAGVATGASSRVEASLAAVLYRFCYTRGAPEPVRATAPPRAAGVKPGRFLESLVRAAPALFVEEEGWTWGGAFRRGGLVRRDGVTFVAAGGLRVDARPRERREGSPVRVLVPAARRGISPGHLVIRGPESGAAPGSVPEVRVYWNARAERAAELIAHVGGGLARRKIPFVLKTLADPTAYVRCDAAVLIAARSDWPSVAAIVSRLAALEGWRRSDRVPAFCLPLAPGIGIADAPPGGASFGERRCALLAAGLVDSARRGEHARSARLATLRRHFAAAGLDMRRPYLEPGSRAYGPLPRPSRRRASGVPKRARTSASALREVARSIADDLCARAVPLGRACTWLDHVRGESIAQNGRGAVRLAPLGFDLHGGTAGVGLFLAGWAAGSGDSCARRTALAAARHAIAVAGDRTRAPGGGFHLGWPGVAWSAAHVGKALGDRALVSSALALARKRLMERSAPGEHDLLGGAAGTLLALLLLDDLLGFEPGRARAIALGDELIGSSRRAARGRSWRSAGPETAGDLTGLSHGAAGIAHALFELHRATGEIRFRRAAFDGIRYERSLFDSSRNNWPDLRSPDRSPGAGPGRGRFVTAWCHGAGGIGMARLHVWIESRDPASRAEARAALRTLRRALEGSPRGEVEDESLCHGAAGLALYLRDAADAGLIHHRRGPALIEWAAERWGTRERAISGTPFAGAGPGLFLGASGIGYAALRLLGWPVPSVLLPAASTGRSIRTSR